MIYPLFPDAAIFPVIGYPSKGKMGMTLTYTGNVVVLPAMTPMTINHGASNSPLANNAPYGAEATQYGYLNLYEMMLPDTPSTNGSPALCTRTRSRSRVSTSRATTFTGPSAR